MFDNLGSFFRKIMKTEPKQLTSKDAAKERLHLVLMQDRANVSADFLELMKQEIINVIKKYIDIDEKEIDVRLTNKQNDDGTTGAPALYANIPIVNIKSEMKVDSEESNSVEEKDESDDKKIEEKDNKEIKEEKEIKSEEKKEEDKVIEEKVEEVKTSEKEIESKKEEDDDVDVPTFDELLKQSEEDVKEEKNSAKSNNKKTKE